MREFFRPTAAKVIVFGVLALIAIGGSLQSSGFGQREPGFLPGLPIWPVWMFLLVPVAVVARAVLRGPAVIFWGVQLVYFYLLACLAARLANLARTWRR